MRVLVIGANGKVGQRIVKKLKDHNHNPVAMIRDESQKAELQAKGAETVVADLEKDFSHAFKGGVDAVIFSAGSGGSTGQDKTVAVDLQGAKASIDEAVKNNVPRYIMVSALGANKADQMSEDMQHYFIAKSEADQYLVQSALDYTIFRPGMLTDEAGTGNVTAAEQLEDYGNQTTSRDDLATAIVESLDKPNTYKKLVEILDGKTPVNDAIAAI